MDDPNGGGVNDGVEAPVEELATVHEDAPEGFAARVRNSIHRRLLASDVADLSLGQILQVFLEFVKIIFESVQRGESRKGEE